MSSTVERVPYVKAHGHGVTTRVARANETLAQRVVSRAASPEAVLSVGQSNSGVSHVSLHIDHQQRLEDLPDIVEKT